jgi:hypothetical protein
MHFYTSVSACAEGNHLYAENEDGAKTSNDAQSST